MPPIVKGQAGPVYSGIRKRYIPGVGWTSAHVYQFSNSVDANAFAATAAAGNTNIVDVDDRVPYTVEVSSPNADGGVGGDEAVDIYELPPLDIEKDIVESPLFQNLGAYAQTLIRAYWRSDTREAYDYAATNLASDNDALAVLRLTRDGSRLYYAPSVEFRWTRIVSDGGLPTASAGAYSGVGAVFTTAQLTAAIGGLPAVWATSIANAAGAYPNPSNIVGQPQYTKGWLKQQSNIVRRGTNRNELTLRWILGNWSDDLY